MDIFSITQIFNTTFIFKVFFLILLALYIIFVFMLLTKVRSFDKIIHLSGASGGSFLKTILVIYLLLLVFLFVTALVIV